MILNIVSSPTDYIPVLIQAFVAIGFVVLVLVVSPLLGPSRKNSRKLKNFECGIEQQGNARNRYSIKYFLVAILFVLFDVEIIFMYPWAVNFRELGSFGFWEMMVFVGIFLAGFYYILLQGVFTWNKKDSNEQ
jgi:NADH-quinone oxidoreductase subunit A